MRNLKMAILPSLTRQAKGKAIEQACCDFLLQQEIIIIAANFRCTLGEIDLIGKKGSLLIFFEVRYRKNHDYGSGIESVNAAKQQRFYKTAQYYLLTHPQYAHFTYRFDIIGATTYNNKIFFDWRKNIFGDL